jgi:hypothetical protein
MAGGDLTPIPPRLPGWKPPSDPTTRFRGPLAPRDCGNPIYYRRGL